MKKISQASLEFLILVGFLLMSFVVFFLVIQINLSDKVRERANTEISEIANIVQNEIDLATQSSEGYSREFRLPLAGYLGDYSLNISDGLLFVESEDKEYILTLAVKNVSGQAVKGVNIIKNENGTIKLNS